jgi:hypothetical protein
MKTLSEFLYRAKPVPSLVLLLGCLITLGIILNRCEKEINPDRTETIDSEITTLKDEKIILVSELDSLKLIARYLDSLIYASKNDRKGLKSQLKAISYERDTLRSYIAKIPSNKIYYQLNNVLYPYIGDTLYRFNENQIGKIYSDVMDFRLIKTENKILLANLTKCEYEANLKDTAIVNRDQQLVKCDSMEAKSNRAIYKLEQKIDQISPNKNTIYTGLIFYQHFPTNKSSIGFSVNYSNEKLSGTFAVDPFNRGVYVGGAVRLKSW